MSKRKAPPPPSGLAKRLHPAYRELWRSSVAHLWTPASAPLVARLVQLRDYVDKAGADVRPAMLSAVLQLERELLLGTKAARASGVTVRDEALPPVPVDVDEDGDAKPRGRRRPADAARRDRVLRVVANE